MSAEIPSFALNSGGSGALALRTAVEDACSMRWVWPRTWQAFGVSIALGLAMWMAAVELLTALNVL